MSVQPRRRRRSAIRMRRMLVSLGLGVALTCGTIVVPTWTDKAGIMPGVEPSSDDLAWIRTAAPAGLIDRARGAAGGELAFAGLGRDIRFGARETSGALWFLVDGEVAPNASGVSVVRHERGWPLLCAEGAWWRAGPQFDWVAVDLLCDPANMSLPVLPYGVRWIPFLIDVSLFAAAAFLLWSGSHGFVRRRRRRAGRCEDCGYRLEDLDVCPECGADQAFRMMNR